MKIVKIRYSSTDRDYLYNDLLIRKVPFVKAEDFSILAVFNAQTKSICRKFYNMSDVHSKDMYINKFDKLLIEKTFANYGFTNEKNRTAWINRHQQTNKYLIALFQLIDDLPNGSEIELPRWLGELIGAKAKSISK